MLSCVRIGQLVQHAVATMTFGPAKGQNDSNGSSNTQWLNIDWMIAIVSCVCLFHRQSTYQVLHRLEHTANRVVKIGCIATLNVDTLLSAVERGPCSRGDHQQCQPIKPIRLDLIQLENGRFEQEKRESLIAFNA